MEKINKKKVFVFLDVSIDGDPLERLTFELFTDVAPKTAENFRALCTGEKGVSPKTGKPLHYKGTFFHRIIKGFVAQAGDFLRQDGNYGESIYGGNFPDESPKLKHDSPGLLSMAIADLDERGSLFSITFKADHNLDRKNIVFGELVDGHEVLKKIENAGDDEGRPSVTVKIVKSGELYDDKKKGKRGKDAVEGNNHEVKRKGKHKKNSNKRRKRRRRYYTSESDSSTDSDMDSSESDTGSDSYASSLSDTSSSSDDRCKKRRRSKRGRHRRGKKMDRRHEKRRKRRDKKSKRKRYCRQSVSNGENDSQSGGSSQDIGKHKASVEEQENAKVHHGKREAADTSEREEGEFPRENGDHQSNGVGMRMESDRSANGGPDVVDDLPSKSRSRSLSPRRTPSRTTSISPRNADRSPGVGAKHNRNGSLTVSRSPQQQISGRSRSNTPERSGNSRSPAENRRGRNVSMSPPARSHSQRSPSRSATVSPSRRRVAHGPPRSSSRRSASRSASGSPVRSSRRSLSRSSSKPSRKSISRSPLRPSHRSVSRSSGRAPPKRSPSPSPVRAPRRINRRSYSRSPVSAARRVRSPVLDRRRSLSRSPVNGSPKHVRRGRVFNDRNSYAHRYGRSPDRSPVRSYRYGGRSDRNRYSSYRRSPRRYGSPPPRGRTPPRYRGRRSRSRSPSVSRSPIRYRNRHYSRSWSPIHSRSPVGRYHNTRIERRRSPSGSRSPSQSRSRSPRDSQLPKNDGEGNSRSSSGSPRDWQSPKSAGKGNSRSSSGSPPRKSGLVAYEDGSPDSGGS